MSLVGQKAAVVSFGISCQTTLQIDDHVELIKHAVGDETLKSSSLPFDAVLTHPISTAQMLDADTFYPASKDELVLRSSDQGDLRLKLNDSTAVTVDGQMGSADQIKPGEDVRASYQVIDGQPTATKIEVRSSQSSTSNPKQ